MVNSGFELPKPQHKAEGETADLKQEIPTQVVNTPEQKFNAAGGGPAPTATSLPFPVMPLPGTSGSATNTTNSGGQSAQTDAPLMADDTDLIEKEWVVKAKQIVERTRDDPHRQNKEINRFKADYMKKRYNRDIKVSED